MYNEGLLSVEEQEAITGGEDLDQKQIDLVTQNAHKADTFKASRMLFKMKKRSKLAKENLKANALKAANKAVGGYEVPDVSQQAKRAADDALEAVSTCWQSNYEECGESTKAGFASEKEGAAKTSWGKG